jgi:hypothetical protein
MIGLCIIRYYVLPGVSVDYDEILTKKMSVYPGLSYEGGHWHINSSSPTSNKWLQEKFIPMAIFDNYTDYNHTEYPQDYQVGYDILGP